ncbi:DUF2510 domain-containing protein [Rhodococcus oxybenzonivorans]|uniref:DUF2510 domain-containing protein n=1 Tax=Rhodococcus oxybenzonivorans TaxID=1990687 RepID=UPI002953BB9D|nr:DUF2510 domain-containing protein [Rhodococcus oxybenzonivorans]MDV7353472.1 DUF2510 domain-containing protein [Rhodococcus oxybenzonivorans]
MAVPLLLGGAGTIWKVRHDPSSAAAEVERASEAREMEAVRLASQQQRQDAERASRAASVPAIEASIKTMADEHAGKGLIDGSIISVTCSPVSGGSTDDLTESTTVFECFAATQDNGDGTKSGYKYHETMNWTTGKATYGLGAP